MKLSEAEWQIMNALWKRHPATARELIEQLPEERKWAYTTVKTMLTRLVNKDIISERKRGNTSVYEPLVSQQKARNTALRTVVEKVLGGTMEPLMHFLIDEKGLTENERSQLIRILEEMDHNTEGNDHGTN